MAYPLLILEKICKPFSQILLNSTSIVNKRIRKKLSFSIEKLSEAINYASESINQDVDILHGIVKFGNTDVKEIMTPRLDVVSVDITSNFMELKNIINESGYSRIPVYESTFDSIRGILYIKDLVKHINDNDLKWSNLIREPYFVPETKKIDDLLQEFQQKKIHMAIVSDEYGGIIGIITLEDILEEIIGEIKDEFDIEENNFKKIDDFTYIFEGKTQLNNFYKILETDEDVFDDLKGDSETLAGLILELRGNFPVKGEIINCHNFSFQIESVDNRKINTIKVTKKIKKPE
jgi:gliding motility-associated protein GldE